MNNVVVENQTKPVRACAACEKEFGILDRTDIRKSHGTCRRHFIIGLYDGGIIQKDVNDAVARMDAIPDSYCPDLAA